MISHRPTSLPCRTLTILAACLLSLLLVRPVTSAPAPKDSMLYPGASLEFVHLTVDDGLSQNAILALLQDNRGFIWAGTQDGLNRYDGYSFTQFKNHPQYPHSLGYNNISSLAQDAAGFLWIGTSGGGLDRYDPQTGFFSHYHPEPGDPTSLADPYVTSLLPDGSNLWVGTLGGLDLLDTATGRFTHYFSDAADPATLSSNAISVITPAADGKLWIGTGANGAAGAGLNSFDPATGQVERFSPSVLCLVSLNISSILVDPLGSLWIGHGGSGLPGGGLDHFNPLTHACQHYDALSTRGMFTNDNVSHLFRDQAGRLWVSFAGGGLALMEPTRVGSFSSLRHSSSDPASLSSDNASALLLDRTGVLWAATSDTGLNLLNLEALQFSTYKHTLGDTTGLASNAISAFAETPDGALWIGTQEAGLALFEPALGRFTYYRNIPSDPASLSSNRILSLFADQDGTLWVGTANSGLNHFDPRSGKALRYRHDSANSASLVDDEVTTILRDSGGSLWVATLGGLSRLDPDSQNFVNYTGLNGAPVALGIDGSDLWIGTWGSGASRLRLALPGILPPDRTRLSIMDTFIHGAGAANSIGENNVWTVFRSPDGLLWFGTAAGLDRYDPKTGLFKLYDETAGLPNASVACITADSRGFLWVTTANGLARFDPHSGSFLAFDKSDGLPGGGFNRNACFASPTTGQIYIGGTDGFSLFDPLAITRNTTPPNVVITGFKVLDQPTPLDPLGRLPVRLNYTQNFISFDFAALDFHAPAGNTYAYRLDGFDKDWVQAGLAHHASYTALPAGNYTFRVKAANNDGTWSIIDATLPIQIVPPLWQRWQFQAGLGFALALLVLAAFEWRLLASRAGARSLEKRMLERTEQLNMANELLREKATQDAVSAERTRLARDLHDAVTQTLFSATLIAEVLPDLWEKNRPEGNRRLEELRQLTRGALAEMRTLLVELRPNALTEIPLPTLLRQLTEALIGRARLDIQLHCSGQRRLAPDVQVGLYRIAQEALNNVVKHAKATQAVVTLHISDSLRLSISDNGIGFDPASVTPDHFGLRSMRERAEAIRAKFQVDSTPGEGTQVSVVLEENHQTPPGS